VSTATLPMEWQGRSGRLYVPVQRSRIRHGSLASVRKVSGRGPATGTSTADEGVPLALKLWREGDEASLDQLQQEARTLVELASVGAELPCPRLYDLVGDPLVTGLVMEWCPLDLERWWRETLPERDAFGRLCSVLAEAARRVSEYQRDFAGKRGLDVAHGDMKPTNVLMSADGRWLVSDFGTAPVRPPQDDVWAESRVVVATDNFLSPEVLFSARRPYPAAVDTWSIGASFFALLKLRRMVLDGSAIPRNGTLSPRFRMERIARVFEVFGRDPQRFVDRELEPDAFADPLRIPDEDRQSVREAVRGVFGQRPDADAVEEQLAEMVSELLDRAVSIDPAHRFTDARDMSAAFEALTRNFLALAAVDDDAPEADPVQLRNELDQSKRRNKELEERLGKLEQALSKLPEAGRTPMPISRSATDARSVRVRLPVWWSMLLAATVVLQVVTLTILAAYAVVVWSG